jgi:hypothetical protein
MAGVGGAARQTVGVAVEELRKKGIFPLFHLCVRPANVPLTASIP